MWPVEYELENYAKYAPPYFKYCNPGDNHIASLFSINLMLLEIRNHNSISVIK